MGAYPTIARWGIVTGSEKIGKREERWAMPTLQQRQLCRKINWDCTLIRIGRSRLRRRSASWRSRRKSGRRPPLRRREWYRVRQVRVRRQRRQRGRWLDDRQADA